MGDLDQGWQRKGATLSDKTAREEFELTQDDIVEAIGAGRLQYRINSTNGNPWFRLVRREVEPGAVLDVGDGAASAEVLELPFS